jgi:Zn-dependent protease with chaperone function
MPFPAIHYGGETAGAEAVQIEFEEPDQLWIGGDSWMRCYPLGSVTGEPALGGARRFLLLPDGGTCEYAADAVDAEWLSTLVPGTRSVVEPIERRPVLAAVASVLVIAAVWGTLSWGADSVARMAAIRIPASAEVELGRRTLAAADTAFLAPSRLPGPTRARIANDFRRLVSPLPNASCYRLHFRSSRALGPNAFALPGCHIVLLDQLVGVAGHRDEVTAVLAHEAGHVRERHAMRGAFHRSLTLMILSLITGDAPPGSMLLATGPGALLQTAHSRDLEREADRIAFELLDRHGIASSRLGDLLARIEARQSAGSPAPDFLSTHPPTPERIRDAASAPVAHGSKRAMR